MPVNPKNVGRMLTGIKAQQKKIIWRPVLSPLTWMEKPAIRQRTISCPDHASIEIALKILVQGASTARHKACADNRVEQEQNVYATARSHVKADESGEQHE